MSAGSARPECRWPRRAVWLGLIFATTLLHGWAVDRVSATLGAGWHASPAPPRLQAAFVRELQPAAPPAAARPAVAPAPPPPPARRPAGPEPLVPAASEPAAPAASAPAPPASEAAPAGESPVAAEVAAAVAALAASAASSVALADAASGATAAAAEAQDPAGDWPLGTRMAYKLGGYVRGEVHGSAQVEWLREGRRYQVHLDVTIGPGFAPMMQRQMSSDGEITAAGLAPRRYDERTRIAFSAARESTVLFDPADAATGAGPTPPMVTLANGRRVPSLPSVQDAASQFVQLTWLLRTRTQPLQTGERITVPLALPRRVDLWTYEVLGEEGLDTPFGRVSAWHLKPQREGDGDALSAEAWFAPGLQYLPVRILIRNGKEDHLDLMIDRLPMQADDDRRSDPAPPR